MCPMRRSRYSQNSFLQVIKTLVSLYSLHFLLLSSHVLYWSACFHFCFSFAIFFTFSTFFSIDRRLLVFPLGGDFHLYSFCFAFFFTSKFGGSFGCFRFTFFFPLLFHVYDVMMLVFKHYNCFYASLLLYLSVTFFPIIKVQKRIALPFRFVFSSDSTITRKPFASSLLYIITTTRSLISCSCGLIRDPFMLLFLINKNFIWWGDFKLFSLWKPHANTHIYLSWTCERKWCAWMILSPADVH